MVKINTTSLVKLVNRFSKSQTGNTSTNAIAEDLLMYK